MPILGGAACSIIAASDRIRDVKAAVERRIEELEPDSGYMPPLARRRNHHR
jgi:hypothetical protein